jgi:PIN domain nuclease of toxin-antitoxin system
MLKEERGGMKVAQVIDEAMISAVNYAEVVSHFIHAGMPDFQIDAMLGPLPLTIVAADQLQARDAGRLRHVTSSAGLSLGDRFCLALAIREALPAWTADKQWKVIADLVDAKVVVIR